MSDTEVPFLVLHLSISDGFEKTKLYDKRDNFDFDIVNFPFLDGEVPRSTSYGVYISQLIRFARVSLLLLGCVPILLTTFTPETRRNVSIAAVRGAVRPSNLECPVKWMPSILVIGF